GSQHLETATARGMLAIGLVRAGRDADADREFKLCLPILTATSRDADDEAGAIARGQRLQIIIESYLTLLARRASLEDVAEGFRFADAVRGRAVQKALSASSARALARDPAQAELARKEQDLEKQVAAQLGLLNNVLALPPEQRDDKALQELRAEIVKLRGQREAARKEIERKFPSYADLTDPKLPALQDIRAVLKADEAFLSFYFGQQASFAWAVSKDGPTAFAAIPLSAGDVERKITTLREALEPKADTAEDIPPFDLALAHELYTLLLQPIEAGWRSAKSVIVVTNGALGLLPLGVLPTAQPAGNVESKLMFDAYRQVPWLARSHAVSQLPSAAALRTLRQLPAASAKRDKLIGFGDPFFSPEQAAEAQKASVSVEMASASRGLALKRRALAPTRGVDSASLALLPRLPDTADELRAVATALEADPAKALNLGKDANERKVKTTDLSRFRVVAFSTHGLVPGELDGLTQPALALTAPHVADVDGDGLLTMEEILALKLDADWVVLSACNTGAGLEAGAEAASGLGRAFFYAGSRALLVTNWSVQSDSARELVTELFRRQAGNARLGRAEALRQAAMAVMDGPGYVRAGQSLYSYAHPFFWAPYSLIGDGSAGN
ncbi:MAG TPA: CHAT domain-containing protein, partial [Hyphomicrobiaceae bacterium]|nr:CHAT domain-containing protein [Hyphomicrobiaceae bacterium]